MKTLNNEKIMKTTLTTPIFMKSTIALSFMKSNRSYKKKIKTFSVENVLVCFG